MAGCGERPARALPAPPRPCACAQGLRLSGLRQVVGPLPASFSALVGLRSLELSDTGINGSLPASWVGPFTALTSLLIRECCGAAHAARAATRGAAHTFATFAAHRRAPLALHRLKLPPPTHAILPSHSSEAAWPLLFSTLPRSAHTRDHLLYPPGIPPPASHLCLPHQATRR